MSIAPDLFVEPIAGEPLRYWVRSDSERAKPRLVDLTEYGGNGMCLCPDFICRREPALKCGAQKFTAETMCKHIRAARTHFTNETLAIISKKAHP